MIATRREEIEHLAQRVKQKYSTCDPYELADWFRIMVDFAPHPRLLGFCLCMLGNRVIGLNSNADVFTRRCACAHELGHHLLNHLRDPGFQLSHMTNLAPCNQRLEAEANAFAAALLMDDTETLEAIRTYPEARNAAAALHVCVELFYAKLESLNARGFHFRLPPRQYLPWSGYVQ